MKNLTLIDKLLCVVFVCMIAAIIYANFVTPVTAK